MKYLIALTLALGAAALAACEASEPTPQEAAQEGAQGPVEEVAKQAPAGQVVTLAITGMT